MGDGLELRHEYTTKGTVIQIFYRFYPLKNKHKKKRNTETQLWGKTIFPIYAYIKMLPPLTS